MARKTKKGATAPRRSDRAKQATASKPARDGLPQVPVTVPVDAALKRAWSAQLARFQAAAAKDMFAFDEKYEAIGAILSHDPPLYLAGGCSTLRDFIQRYVHEDERVVRSWVDVATHASPDDEIKYGPSRLAALLVWLRAKGKGAAVKTPIAWAKLVLDVPSAAKGASGSVRVKATAATVQQIRAATRALTPGKKPSQNPRAGAEARAVLAALEGMDAFTATRVTFRDGAFAFTNVPAYALADFCRRLARVTFSDPAPGPRAAKPPKKTTRG